MKVFIAILVLLLVAVLGVVGYNIIIKNTPQPASSVPQTIQRGEVAGPNTPFKVPEALAKAIELNRDTVAWLQIPDTDINNSVVQASDNLYYERRNEAKQDEIYGCYFADYECALGARETLMPNTIIYGHESPGDDPNGKRFSQLYRFTDIEFAKSHPYIYITTPEERMSFEIFSIFYTDTSFDYIQVNITDDEMLQISQKGVELSIYEYPTKPAAADRVLTLSTCTEKFGTDGNHRFVIQARLLESSAQEAESIELEAKG